MPVGVDDGTPEIQSVALPAPTEAGFEMDTGQAVGAPIFEGVEAAC